ncbi:NAD(P)-binding protein [Martensiomyces pterosporus]|nr:NAD(P)-binding protein [Martensiomyces pterosporus]
MTQETSSQAPVKVAIVGCGNRGSIYGQYALLSAKMQVVAIADRSPVRRKAFQSKHQIPSEHSHESWRSLLDAPKIADAVLICVLDRLHKEVAVAFANRGYHILLEKPMATELSECQEVYQAAKSNNVMLAVCHVLRYTPYNRKVKEVVDSGILGDIVGIQHMEPVGHYHFAHSFVRGNWRNEKESSFSLMTKSCHDIDIILYFMGNKCKKVTSFGGLSHFKHDRKPAEAGDAKRCMDCAFEPQCPYSAKAIYLEPAKRGHKQWPLDVITNVVDIENVTDALQHGPYGRCVYECDNDVCDNQVVNMEFADNRYASFTMVAFTEEICVRKTRIFGTRGELVGDGDKAIEVYDFVTRKKTAFEPDEVSDNLAGHGGGDMGIIEAFVDAVATNDPSLLASDALSSLDSHVLVFAAEESRRRGTVVDLDAYRRENSIAY